MTSAEQPESKLSVTEAVRAKRAVRAYSAEPVPEEVVRAILNAGRRAQSSKNDQPWIFVVVRQREQLQRLSTAGTYAAHALILRDASANPASIVAEANRRLESHQRIQSWSVWPEEDFPRTASTMKVKRGEVARCR